MKWIREGETVSFCSNAPASPNNDGTPEAIVQDLAGSALNNSPDFKFNVGAYWEQNLGNSDLSWFAQGNYQWQDDINYDLFGTPSNAQDAYGIANFSVGIIHPEGKYRITAFVNNAFDELFYSRIDDSSDRRDDGQAQISVQRARASTRYAGVKFQYQF